MKKLFSLSFLVFVFALIIMSCKKNSDNNNTTTPVPDVYKKIYGADFLMKQEEELNVN